MVDYLADTLTAERVLCLATTRTERPSRSADLLDRLRSRRVATVLPLAPLPDAECAQMVRACLAGADVDAAVPGFVTEHSDGLPFLVEELLAGPGLLGCPRPDGRRVARRGAADAVDPRQLRRVAAHPPAGARRGCAAGARRRGGAGPPLRLGSAAGRRRRRRCDGRGVAAPGGRRAARHRGRPAVPVPARADARGRARRAPPAGEVRAVGEGARRGAAGAPRPARPVVRAGRRARRGGRGPGVGGGVHGRERPARFGPRRAGQRGADGRTRPAAGSGRVGGRGRCRRGAGDDPRARREARAGAGDRARAAADARRAGRTGRPAGRAPAAPRAGCARRR